MAITFNPIEKIIQLDRFTISERELWTAMVDWSVTGDNLKYGVTIEQVGGAVPIALYVYLSNGWRIRPVEADGTTTITGNLLTSNGDHPVVPTIGNWQVLVNMETPLQAASVSTGSCNAITDIQIHEALDSYTNKADYKNNPQTIADAVLDSPA